MSLHCENDTVCLRCSVAVSSLLLLRFRVLTALLLKVQGCVVGPDVSKDLVPSSSGSIGLLGLEGSRWFETSGITRLTTQRRISEDWSPHTKRCWYIS